jgi:multicomponent Na+:H+ antiporter subunit G
VTLTVLQLLAVLLLAVAIGFSVIRLLRGPTTLDRVVAADTLAVIATAGLVGLATVFDNPVYLDVALVYGTKAATLGAMALLLGVGLHYPDWWPKLLVIAGFVLFTNPVGSSTIARAARITGIKPWSADRQQGDA